ncbi:MAG: hypothetical protein CTY19_00995 [Methylomonas sp.]|nr:MAG: hypothetical protein CTY19_00995 [Methylomonas sp.]
MNKKLILAGAIGLSIFGSSSAFAHVDYGDLNAFPTQSTTFLRKGWFAGTDTPLSGCGLDGTAECLGDSHQLQFFKFSLAQDSLINLSFTSIQNGLNPAFSLYRGLLPDEAHDDTSTDPLNAVDGNFDPISHPTDSAYWDSNNIREGQFNAFGNWSMANDDEAWAEIVYITHKNDFSASSVGSVEALTNYFLQAGSYTVAAAGATSSGPSALLQGTIAFSASPVPVPGAVWLFGSAIAGLIGFGKRKSAV